MKIRLLDTSIGLRCYLWPWALLVSLSTLQGWLHDALLDGGGSGFDYLRWSLIVWLPWIFAAPYVFRVAERHPLGTPLDWRNVRALAANGAGYVLFALAIGAVVSHGFEPGTLAGQFAQFFGKHFATACLTYVALVAVHETVRIQRDKLRREGEAGRLAAELAQSRLVALKAQLQPHFLFNTLHAIVTLLEEEPASAEDMLLRLSELLRALLEDREGQEVTLERELELLDLYLGIQRVRFKDRLATRVYVEPELFDAAVPPLILQPLVENAIHHGIGRNVGGDTIEIDARRDGDALLLEVRNSNSVLEGAPQASSGHGIGLSNTRLRLRELYGDAAALRLGALWPKGVACRVRLPLRQLDAAGDDARVAA